MRKLALIQVYKIHVNTSLGKTWAIECPITPAPTTRTELTLLGSIIVIPFFIAQPWHRHG